VQPHPFVWRTHESRPCALNPAPAALQSLRRYRRRWWTEKPADKGLYPGVFALQKTRWTRPGQTPFDPAAQNIANTHGGAAGTSCCAVGSELTATRSIRTLKPEAST